MNEEILLHISTKTTLFDIYTPGGELLPPAIDTKRYQKKESEVSIMNQTEMKNALLRVNSKQEEINRMERRLDKLYKSKPVDGKRIDKLEERISDERKILRGMVEMLGCLLHYNRGSYFTNYYPRIEFKSEPENPFCGTWEYRDILPDRDRQYYLNRKAMAESEAIEYQRSFDENPNIYYSELVEKTEYFKKLGKRFGLLEVFKENGII